MKQGRIFATFLLVSMAAICLAVVPAKAQITIVKGQFSMQSETHWGKHNLPKGTYSFSLTRATENAAYMTISNVRAPSHGLTVSAIEEAPENSLRHAGSTLVISRYGNTSVVRALYLAGSSSEYAFQIPKDMQTASTPAGKMQSVSIRVPVTGSQQ